MSIELDRHHNYFARAAYTRCPDLKWPKVMAYYYGTTQQNVINCSSKDWKTIQEFGSSPIGSTCAPYSAIADDKLFTLTSLVQMWMPQ
ncbi:hypothetical protein TNCV_196761 [Trichonephila clavipes]|uniref:Uncharacterized protein n=1 Tax=Trichonephila clavipes TaxID=2585209 RepID=A0A8X6WKQ9_TRICX|nr:hypothetical protein TNCV_196761 [Trichonephila clavipes]